MAGSETSENSKNFDGDRRKFTFEWATEVVIRLRNFATALASSRDGNSLSWLFHKWIGDVFDSFFALKDQKDLFDFECFKHPSGQSVDIFGKSYASYHAAAKEVLDAVVHAIWFPAFFVYDASNITKENADVTKIVFADIEDITAAFCNATNVELKDVQPRLLKLGTGLCAEHSTVNATGPSDSTADGRKADTRGVIQNQWWHDPTEPRPTDYKYGPVTGMKKDISRWMGEKATSTPRRLEQKAASRVVWVIRHNETSWEVWFKDERLWEMANRNRRFGVKMG